MSNYGISRSLVASHIDPILFRNDFKNIDINKYVLIITSASKK